MEGDFENSNARLSAFKQLKQQSVGIESLPIYSNEMRLAIASDQVHDVLGNSAKLIRELKRQLEVVGEERDKFKAQIQGYRQQIGSQRESLKQKLDHRENMVKIVQKNSKEQLNELEMEKEQVLKRLGWAQEKLRELNGQLESLKIENMRINNENRFLRKEREQSYERAKVDVLERQEESLSVKIREARDEGFNCGRRQGQISRENEIQKLKEVLNQYKQDVERQSIVISRLNGQIDQIKAMKRLEIELNEKDNILERQKRIGQSQYRLNQTGIKESKDDTLKQYLQRYHHQTNSSQNNEQKNFGSALFDSSKQHPSITGSSFQQSYLKDY